MILQVHSLMYIFVDMEWPNSPIFPAVAPTTSSTRVFRVRDQMIGIQLSPRERQDGMLFYESKLLNITDSLDTCAIRVCQCVSIGLRSCINF